MNFKKISLSIALLGLGFSYASTPSELLTKKCASCHMLTSPKIGQLSSLKAPAMDAVAFHTKLAYPKAKDQKAFMIDYVLNPNASKAVCESNKVSKFGVMPSQKGNVTKEELSQIIDYILKTYPHTKFEKMIKNVQINAKINSLLNSPFLINKEALPHMTKILIENWDKATINLSDEQKSKLLKVRKETMDAVKEIKPQIAKLENAILEMSVDGEELDTIKPLVDKVAKLKAQGTMIHLKCIKDTVETLDEKQLEAILPFWGV